MNSRKSFYSLIIGVSLLSGLVGGLVGGIVASYVSSPASVRIEAPLRHYDEDPGI